MKIDCDKEIKGLNGEPLEEKIGLAWRLGSVIAASYHGSLESEAKDTLSQKRTRHRMAERFFTGEQELTKVEMEEIKNRVGEIFPSVLVGPVCDILEEAENHPDLQVVKDNDSD